MSPVASIKAPSLAASLRASSSGGKQPELRSTLKPIRSSGGTRARSSAGSGLPWPGRWSSSPAAIAARIFDSASRASAFTRHSVSARCSQLLERVAVEDRDNRGVSEILTVGHSTYAIERFLRLLGARRVEALADVRRFPGSRRNPQFNAGALAESLRGAGIEYVRLGDELGGRRDRSGRGDRSAPRPRTGPFAAYAQHMSSEEFAAGLDRLEALARAHRTALMCAEADWRRCHRRLIADALGARGWRVLHLLADGRLEQHPASILD